MLKSNTKRARENIRAYITDSCEDYLRERYDRDDELTFDELARLIMQTFKAEQGYEVTRRQRRVQDAFLGWGSGLACGGLFNYYITCAKDCLGDILEETQEERDKYTEEQAENYLGYLIYREVSRCADFFTV